MTPTTTTTRPQDLTTHCYGCGRPLDPEVTALLREGTDAANEGLVARDRARWSQNQDPHQFCEICGEPLPPPEPPPLTAREQRLIADLRQIEYCAEAPHPTSDRRWKLGQLARDAIRRAETT